MGVGEVPGAVPINGLTNCVSDASTGGVDVPPPAGGAGGDPPDDEVGEGALFAPPHAANIKVKATPTVLFRILVNMICLIIGKYPACVIAPDFFFISLVLNRANGSEMDDR
ncbi:hypothetical protein GCM10027093_61730 [Paraburkholderia jirisanensis]